MAALYVSTAVQVSEIHHIWCCLFTPIWFFVNFFFSIGQVISGCEFHVHIKKMVILVYLLSIAAGAKLLFYSSIGLKPEIVLNDLLFQKPMGQKSETDFKRSSRATLLSGGSGRTLVSLLALTCSSCFHFWFNVSVFGVSNGWATSYLASLWPFFFHHISGHSRGAVLLLKTCMIRLGSAR